MPRAARERDRTTEARLLRFLGSPCATDHRSDGLSSGTAAFYPDVRIWYAIRSRMLRKDFLPMAESKRALLLTILLVMSLGCGDEGKGGDVPPQEQESSEVRASRAAELFRQAGIEPPPDKIPLLLRLIATYPEFSRIVEANMSLIMYLMDHSVDRVPEAEKATLIFAERHPAEPSVSECFRWLALHYRGKGETGRQALEALLPRWESYLDGALKLAKGEKERAQLHLSRAEICGWQGRTQEAVPWLREGLRIETPDLRVRQTTALQLARLLRETGESREEMLKAYQLAVKLGESSGRGESADAIRAEWN